MPSSSYLGADDQLPFDPGGYRLARLDQLTGNIPIDRLLVRARRADRCLTQRQAAARAEITQNRWQQLEVPRDGRGANVKAVNLIGVAKALEVPPELLVGLPINADALKRARTGRSLTQQHLADRCSIPVSQIAHFEDTATELEPKAFWSTIQTLAIELGLQPTDLLIPRPTDPNDSPSGPGLDRYKRPDGTSFTLSPRDSLMLRRFLEELPSYSTEYTESRGTGQLVGVVGTHGKTTCAAARFSLLDGPQDDDIVIIGAGGAGLRAAMRVAEAEEPIAHITRIHVPGERCDGTTRASDGIVDGTRNRLTAEADVDLPSCLVPGALCVRGTLGDDRFQPSDLAIEARRGANASETHRNDSASRLGTLARLGADRGTDDNLELVGYDTVRGSDVLGDRSQSIDYFVVETEVWTPERVPGQETRRALGEEDRPAKLRETVMLGGVGHGLRDAIRVAEMTEALLENLRASQVANLVPRSVRHVFRVGNQVAEVQLELRLVADFSSSPSPGSASADCALGDDRLSARDLVVAALSRLGEPARDGWGDVASADPDREFQSALKLEHSLRQAGTRSLRPVYQELTEPILIYSSQARATNDEMDRERDGTRYALQKQGADWKCVDHEESRHEVGGMGDLEGIGLVGERQSTGPAGTHSKQTTIRVATDADFDPVTILDAVEAAIARLDVEERAAVLLTCAREEGLDLLGECDANRVNADAAARGWQRVAQSVGCDLGRVLVLDEASGPDDDCEPGNFAAEFVIDPGLSAFASLRHRGRDHARPH